MDIWSWSFLAALAVLLLTGAVLLLLTAGAWLYRCGQTGRSPIPSFTKIRSMTATEPKPSNPITMPRARA